MERRAGRTGCPGALSRLHASVGANPVSVLLDLILELRKGALRELQLLPSKWKSEESCGLHVLALGPRPIVDGCCSRRSVRWLQCGPPHVNWTVNACPRPFFRSLVGTPVVRAFTEGDFESPCRTRRRFPIDAALRSKVQRIPSALDAAESPRALDVPGFRLHTLKGDLEGFWSVTVNGNW